MKNPRKLSTITVNLWKSVLVKSHVECWARGNERKKWIAFVLSKINWSRDSWVHTKSESLLISCVENVGKRNKNFVRDYNMMSCFVVDIIIFGCGKWISSLKFPSENNSREKFSFSESEMSFSLSTIWIFLINWDENLSIPSVVCLELWRKAVQKNSQRKNLASERKEKFEIKYLAKCFKKIFYKSKRKSVKCEKGKLITIIWVMI